MPSISTADAVSLKHTLIVMLPGRGDRLDTFGGHKWTAWSPLWARIAAEFKQFDQLAVC